MDPTDEENPKANEDRYLMSRFSNTGVHANHSRLSDKSRTAIREILDNDLMTHCLQTISKAALCGDGIVQDGEVPTRELQLTYYGRVWWATV